MGRPEVEYGRAAAGARWMFWCETCVVTQCGRQSPDVKGTQLVWTGEGEE